MSKYVTLFGLRLRVGSAIYRWLEKNKKAIEGALGKHKHKKHPPALLMYDSINVSQIPKKAQAVAGYVGGKWPTYNELVKKYPEAHKLSIAISADEDADCLDIEKWDATIDQVPAWVKRAAKSHKPYVYTSLSQAKALIDTLAKAKIKRDSYKLWTAHYTGRAHRCDVGCGYGFKDRADATQYDDHALGRNLDVSLCALDFFEGK